MRSTLAGRWLQPIVFGFLAVVAIDIRPRPPYQCDRLPPFGDEPPSCPIIEEAS